MTATAPLVSIVTRTLGRDCLVEAGASVAAQTYRPLEWIVVDAAGKGLDVAPIGDVPTRVISRGERMLRSVAGNFAFGHCAGRWLLNLDDDDLLLPNHVARLAAALTSNPGCMVAYADVATWDAPGHVAGLYAYDYSHYLLTLRNLFPPHAALFDHRLVREFGVRYDEDIDYFDDWDLWLQMARHTRFVRVPGISAIYRLYLSGSGVMKVDTGGAEPRAHDDGGIVRSRYADDRARLALEHGRMHARAQAASDRGDHMTAAQLWRETLAVLPHDPEAATRLAEHCLVLGDAELARNVLDTAELLMPGEATIPWNLAIVLDALSDRDGAARARARALALDATLTTEVPFPLSEGSR